MEFIEKVNDFTVDKIPTSTNTQLHDNFEDVFNKIFGKSGFVVNINGSANSGKTNLLLNLFVKPPCKKTKKKRNFEKVFDNIFVVSPNLKSLKKNIFSDLDDEYLYDDLNDFLMNYRDVMDNYIESIKKENYDPETHTYDDDDDVHIPETLIVFDDVGESLRSKGNKELYKQLICNRRHEHISIINLTQRMIQIDPTVRSNLSALITFYLKTKSDDTFIYEEFTKFPSKYKSDFFDAIFQKPYDFLLIDLSLKYSKTFEYYRNFNHMNIIMKNEKK